MKNAFEKVTTCIVLAEMAVCMVFGGLCFHEASRIAKKNLGSKKEGA